MRTLIPLLLALPLPAWSAEAPAAQVVPTLLHVPPATARAGQPLAIRVQPQGDWRLARIDLVARPLGSAAWTRYAFARTGARELEAVIPGERVQPPGLEYYLESVGTDGARRLHFASAEAPHGVNVYGESAETEEAARLADWRGQRSELRLASTAAAFGSNEAAAGRTDRFSDRFWQVEADYAYRPLRTLYQFGFGFGLMRGDWPEVDGAPVSREAEPGVNYGHADVELLVHPRMALGARLLLGANADGFVAGGGVSARIGRLAGTHLAARFDDLAGVGYRADLRFHWATVPRFPMALGIEFTDWPHPDSPTAAMLSYDLGWRATDQWTVALRVGAANRSASLDAGFLAGLAVTDSF
jgi:hypothetical protein